MAYLLMSLLDFPGSYIIEYGVAGSHTLHFVRLYTFIFYMLYILEEQEKLPMLCIPDKQYKENFNTHGSEGDKTLW